MHINEDFPVDVYFTLSFTEHTRIHHFRAGIDEKAGTISQHHMHMSAFRHHQLCILSGIGTGVWHFYPLLVYEDTPRLGINHLSRFPHCYRLLSRKNQLYLVVVIRLLHEPISYFHNVHCMVSFPIEKHT